MKKLTFKELLEIDQIVGRLYTKDPALKETKFGYAYTKYYKKNFTPIQEELGEATSTIRINNALEDPTTKAILTDEKNVRGYKYSKEGLKKCIEEEKNIFKEFENKEIEIEPYISSLIPEGLSEEETLLMSGVVI